MIISNRKWAGENGMALCWTQQDIGKLGEIIWTKAHGLLWSEKPSPGRLLASVYVTDGAYLISTMGLYGMKPDQREKLEKHLQEELKLTKGRAW